MRFGMVPDAGNKLDFVRKLDQVIVGAQRKGLTLHLGIFVRGEDDYRNIFGPGVGAILTDKRQAINAGHDEVLEDNSGLELTCNGESFAGIRTVMKIYVPLMDQSAPDRLTHHRLIVDKQDHHVIIGQSGRAAQVQAG